MNPWFTQLANRVQRAGIDADQLIAALFLIRAPWSLRAIVPCSRHLIDLCAEIPATVQELAFEDQAERLQVLQLIAGLDDLPEPFRYAHVRRPGLGATGLTHPLYGYSGDSGLAELLLMKPAAGPVDAQPINGPQVELFAGRPTAEDAQAVAFRFLCAWFAFQTFRHQATQASVASYRAYLLGDGVRRLKRDDGGRLYEASRAIRHFGDPQQARAAVIVARLIGTISKQRSRILPDLLDRLAKGEAPAANAAPDPIDPWLARLAVEPIPWATGVPQQALDASRKELAGMARWLRLVWHGDAVRPRVGGGVHSYHHGTTTIDLYPDAVMHFGRVDLGRAGTAWRLDIHPAPPAAGEEPMEHVAQDDVDDDPAEDGTLEPAVAIYLAEGDPQKAFYASKAARHRMERRDALLPWPVWRLSERTLRWLIVRVGAASHDPDDLGAAAWLAIGLSLVTGRPLSVVARPVIQERVAAADEVSADRVVIERATHVLSVPAARPQLQRFRWRPDPFPEYCVHWARRLRMPLPEAWWALVERVAGGERWRASAVVTRARSLLEPQRAQHPVTPAGVAGALWLALQAAGRDDLALTKVLTDFEVANARNLIHYASYPRQAVEALWRQIVAGWAGPLPQAVLPAAFPDERVGSPYGIDRDKIASKVAEVKIHLAKSLQGCDWPAVYNQLTLYTAMWLGLGTAGRRVCQPVPGAILDDGWALVRDKSRADESVDRYVPLTPALRAQIGALRALTHALSLADPAFALADPAGRHQLNLRLFVRQARAGEPVRLRVLEFQPKYADRTAVLRNLPGNWGRKLVRSTASELSGWFKDAGLGHWTHGRHPWSTTSAFPARRFREQWLALQDRLERELGFTVLGVPMLGEPARPVARPLPQPEPEAAPKKGKERSAAEVESLLHGALHHADYAAVCAAHPPGPQAVKKLVESVLAQHAQEPPGTQRRLAEDLCRHLRTRVGVKVFVSDPRARFTRTWLVSRQEFRSLAYVERHLLPRIAEDFAHLPERDPSPEGQRVDLGRLLVALAWRGGVLEVRHLDAVMACLTPDGASPGSSDSATKGSAANDRAVGSPDGSTVSRPSGRSVHREVSVCAVGDVRVLALRRVATRRSRTSVSRTVLLEPYLATLVTVERVALRAALVAAFAREGPKRAAYWNRVFRAYLRALHLPANISLSLFVGALRQRMLLDAAPAVAAYASGETWTYDLPVEELCRLAGYAAPLATGRQDDPSAAEEADAPDADLPEDMQDALTGFGRRLADCRATSVVVWREHIAHAYAAAAHIEEKLFCGFASHLLASYDASREPRALHARELATVRSELQIVWRGLVRAHLEETRFDVLDEAGLGAMEEWTEDWGSVRRHHGAWNAFRRYLVDPHGEHHGVMVRGVDTSSPRAVNARILSEPELERTATLLMSVRSGIPTQEYRDVGARHFALTRNLGTRRAEATGLRWEDVDDNLIRVEPYAGHTLKTENAERVLPCALLPTTAWDRLIATRAPGMAKVIDARPGRPAAGDNFYHAVSRVMQHVTGDLNISHHAVRHTVASALALKVLANGVALDCVAADLPWVAPLLPDDRQLAALLGPAGQCGQGLKAIAVALGHLHETTTLRHYVHTLCVALYAYTLSLPRIPLHTAFQHRAASRASLARIAKQAKDEGCAVPVEDRRLRDYIEHAAARATRDRPGVPPVLYATEPVAEIPWATLPTERVDMAASWLRRVETWHNHLAHGDGVPPENVNALRRALVALAAIPSGKRGTSIPRHVLAARARDGTPMPEMIQGMAALERVTLLVAWLLKLRGEHADLYTWLLEKWRTASAADDGSMRLDGVPDAQCAGQLQQATDAGLEVRLEPVKMSRARTRTARKSTSTRYRMRLRFSDTKLTGRRQDAMRGLGEIRWVLSWLLVEQDVAAAAIEEASQVQNLP